MSDENSSVEEALRKALDYAEDKESEYWIRTALQRIVVEESLPDDPS